MNIVFTCDSMGSGGAEKVISLLTNQFISMGHKVSIVMVSCKCKDSFYKLDSNVKLVPLLKGFKKKPNLLKRIRILKKTLKDINPDVVIAFLPHVIAYTYFSVKSLKTKLIVSERNDPKKNDILLKLVNKYVFRKADGCVFQNNEAKRFYGNKLKKEIIIYNPIEIDLNNKMINSKRKKIIVGVGRFVQQKRFDLLIKSFNVFVKNKPGFKLHLYGKGPLENEYKQLIKNLGLEKIVFLKGLDANWHKKEFNSSIFVSTSDYEGFPNALAEALYLGLPCVSTDCPAGGPRDLSGMFDNLYLSKVGDVGSIVESMNKALKDKTLNSNDKLNPKFISEQWIKFLEGVILNDKIKIS